jgi:ferredoxin-like protein FixX
MFIEIAVDDESFLAEPAARALVEACPVEIFEPGEGAVRVNREQEDECVLCARCLEIAGGKLRVVKLYE